MNKVSKLGFGLLSALAVSPVFADGEVSFADSAVTAIESVRADVGTVLIAAFGIAIAFVTYKLIKRAVNKA